MIERSILLIELESHLGNAAGALRAAWILCKNNGMEGTAKEIADTVLDVETAHERIRRERTPNFEGEQLPATDKETER